MITGDLDIQNELTLTNGALDLDTNDPAISIGGALAITSGAEWIKGDGSVTFDGVTQLLSDANTNPNDLGDALINSYISMTIVTNVIFYQMKTFCKDFFIERWNTIFLKAS